MRRIVETQVDWSGIESDLAGLEPPTISVRNALDRLKPSLDAQVRRGVTTAQMVPILKARGIVVGRKALAHYLETGELPAPPPRAARPPIRNGPDPPPTHPARSRRTRACLH